MATSAIWKAVGDGTRLQSQPALLGHTDHDGMVRLEHEHRAIKQPLIARQRDYHLGSAPCGCPEAMPRNIGGGYRQEIDGTPMFEFVKLRGKPRIKTASQHPLDSKHRLPPL